MAELTGKELAIWNRLIKSPKFLGIKETDFAQTVQAVLVDVIKSAKDEFAAQFGGVYPAGNEIGIADLRPHHIGGSATWRKQYTSTGWQDWLADKTIDENIYVVIYGFENIEPVPKTTEISIKAGVQTIPPIDLVPLKRLDYIKLEYPLVLTPETAFDSDVRVSDTGYDGLKPVGKVVGKGNTIVKKAYY